MSQNPWCESGESGTTTQTTFEDNFTSTSTEKLPDSEEYLESLEKKLNKLKTNTSVLKQLTDRREECMEKLLNGTIDLPTNSDLDFDDSSNRPVLQLVRHIIPEQALNTTELVHIIKHDHLAATETTEDVDQAENETESKN
ncbi:hypothetical protein HA402_013103 [Bradysia odoriphaga]|nr:hypothetical protein HA402_013103 [Bradysia odoriphaga]